MCRFIHSSLSLSDLCQNGRASPTGETLKYTFPFIQPTMLWRGNKMKHMAVSWSVSATGICSALDNVIVLLIGTYSGGEFNGKRHPSTSGGGGNLKAP